MNQDNYIRKATVVHVVDGDTLDAEIDLGYHVKVKERFRFTGINAPERGDEPGYENAKNFVKEKALGKEIFILSEKFERGSFHRYLGTIFYLDENGVQVNLNQQLLDEGLAKAYK